MERGPKEEYSYDSLTRYKNEGECFFLPSTDYIILVGKLDRLFGKILNNLHSRPFFDFPKPQLHKCNLHISWELAMGEVRKRRSGETRKIFDFTLSWLKYPKTGQRPQGFQAEYLKEVSEPPLHQEVLPAFLVSAL